MPLPGPSTPITPSSRQPPVIPRAPSSTLPHPSASQPSHAFQPGLKRPSVYDRNLHRRAPDTSLAAFAFLFSESVQYLQRQSSGVQDLERRLNVLGYHVGQRVLELVSLREGKSARRETSVLGVLHFVHTTLWRAVFGRVADALEKSNDTNTQYMIIDNNPLVTRYVSVPKELGGLSCVAFAAGIVEAALDGSLFTATVTAHAMDTAEFPLRTVFVIDFDPAVAQH